MKTIFKNIALYTTIACTLFFTACPTPITDAQPTPAPIYYPPVVGANLVINEVTNPYWGNFPITIEIYNPNTASINLAAYKLRTSSIINDGSYTGYSSLTFSLPSLDIPSGGYALIRSKIYSNYESGGMIVFVDDGQAVPNYPWYSEAGGFVELLRDGTTVDFLHWGTDSTSPTTGTFVFSGVAPAFPTAEANLASALARDVNSTNTHAASDWTNRAWSTLGGPNDVITDIATDNDGIPDSAKVSNSSTFAGLPLYTWGARSGKRDIFIHIDYMVDGSIATTDPGVIPQKAALDKVVAMFATHNIAIHFDVGDLYGTGVANYNLDGRSHAVPYVASATLGKSNGYANVYKYRASYMPVNKNRVFFYMLFANSQLANGNGGSSGLANLPGNCALITLGHWGLTTTPGSSLNTLVNYQASTIMHEFGHNLGLGHGGDEATNYKPNYFSIMNYLYQLNGLPTIGTNDDTRYYYQYKSTNGSINASYSTKANRSTWTDAANSASFKFDYSDGTGAAINEAAVNDNFGIRRASALAIDFANAGAMNPNHSVNILQLLYGGTPALTTLTDYDDWTHISSVFQRTWAGVFNGATQDAAPAELQNIFNNPNPPVSEPCAPNPESPQGK